MSVSQNSDGGPAFPAVVPEDWHEKHHGMTLRDYFAAKAMAAMLGSDSIIKFTDTLVNQADFHRGNWIAEQAYSFADSMIAARGAA